MTYPAAPIRNENTPMTPASNAIPEPVGATATPELMAAQPAAPAEARGRSALLTYGPVAALIVVLLVLAGAFVPSFLTVGNVLNILQQMAIIGVISAGMTFVILTAGIDLSVGATLELSTVVFAMGLGAKWPVVLAILVALGVGAAVGLINGIGYTVFKIQPFVMTLATLAAAEGLALTLSNGSEVYFTTSSHVVEFLGGGGIGGLSGEFVVFVALAIISWVVLKFVPFGRFVYAVGGSLETSRLAGVKVNRVLLSVYVISGVGAAIGGIMTASRLGVGEPTAGGLTNLDAIAAVVIGGTSLMGGRGNIWGTVAGALVLAVITNVITLLGISPYQSEIIRGGVIVVAVLLGSGGLILRRFRPRSS